MISEVDIEAWREDEKQTDFLQHRQKAVNHEGWAVECLFPGGWKQVSLTYGTWVDAHASLERKRRGVIGFEYRVYEVLK